MITLTSLKELTEDELSILFFIANDFGQREDFDYFLIKYHRLEALGQKFNKARSLIKESNIAMLDAIWSKLTNQYQQQNIH